MSVDMVDALQDLARTTTRTPCCSRSSTKPCGAPKVEQAHYQTQFNTMIADDTDLRTDGTEILDQTVDGRRYGDELRRSVLAQSRYDAYQAAATTRDNAGVEAGDWRLRQREAATTAVATAFTNPQNFLPAVGGPAFVREGPEGGEVTRLAGLTGDDAATEAETTAAADSGCHGAGRLLMRQRTRRPPSRTWWLRAARSRTWSRNCWRLSDAMAGDDGGALVDAIVGAYDGQDAAAARLDAPITAESTVPRPRTLTAIR